MVNVTKKIINTDKLINTGSANLEIKDLPTENQFWKDTFIAYQEFQDNLEINDWNEYLYGLTKILELTNKVFLINPGMKKG